MDLVILAMDGFRAVFSMSIQSFLSVCLEDDKSSDFKSSNQDLLLGIALYTRFVSIRWQTKLDVLKVLAESSDSISVWCSISLTDVIFLRDCDVLVCLIACIEFKEVWRLRLFSCSKQKASSIFLWSLQ